MKYCLFIDLRISKAKSVVVIGKDGAILSDNIKQVYSGGLHHLDDVLVGWKVKEKKGSLGKSFIHTMK